MVMRNCPTMRQKKTRRARDGNEEKALVFLLTKRIRALSIETKKVLN